MPFPGPGDLASTILSRNECLDALVHQPRTKSELVETLEIPRSTLDDIVRELDDAGLVEYTDGRWRATTAGQLARSVHQSYFEELSCLVDAAPVLDALAVDDEIAPAFLDGADVHEPRQHVVDSVLSSWLDRVEAATDVRIVTPRILTGFGRRQSVFGIGDPDASFELIAPNEVHDWFFENRRLTPTVSDRRYVSFLRTTVPFSYGLSLFDDCAAAITAFNEGGIAGFIVNDSTRAIDWAEEQYEQVRRDATPVNVRRESG